MFLNAYKNALCDCYALINSNTNPKTRKFATLCTDNLVFVTDRDLLTGHNAMLLRQIARDLLYAYYIDKFGMSLH